MTRGRILVVEDDLDIASMLRIYFTGQGYEISLAGRGQQALDLSRQELPSLIVLDILLPDMDGYAVCRELRTSPRTRHIPIIFLTQKDERSDRIAGLELGADDYITKPFDIEELRLRVQNAMARAERESLTDPRTGLPAGSEIERELRQRLRETDWTLLDCRIESFDAYREVYGFLAADEVLRATAKLLGASVEADGADGDFIGHAGGENFLVVTSQDRSAGLCQALKQGFDELVPSHYTPIDRDRGHLLFDRPGEPDQLAPFMTLAIGLLPADQAPPEGLTALLAAAAARRRLDAQGEV